MQAATDRLDFAPPPTPGWLRSLGLALLAHAFLVVALTFGVQWKSEPVTMSAEAELWSALPQEAASKLLETPPEPPAPPEPPVPVLKPEPPRPTPAQIEELQAEADIALAQEKQRIKKEKKLELEKQHQAELKLEKLKQEKLKQDKLDKQEKLDKLKQEKLLQEKKQLAEKRLQEQRELEKKAAEDKKKTALDTKRKDALKAQQDKLDAQKMEAQRAENLKRMSGLAGATGGANAKGSALQSSGPSASYAGRIRARIKPNIVFTDEIVGNPLADVEVRLAPDGTIVSRKLSKSSGDKAWDEAVLKAIDKTEVLPRDVDGRIISPLTIGFRPKD
jgi:colicin import membrane protein